MFKPQFGWPCHFIDKNKRFLNIQQDTRSAETEHGETKGKHFNMKSSAKAPVKR